MGAVQEVAVRIPLHDRDGAVIAYALVDECDADHARHRWYCHGGYAVRTVFIGGRRLVRLHREILGLAYGDGVQTDHINRDRLDNRRANLRAATHAENHQNVGSREGSTSVHRGVSWGTKRRKWVAQVVLGGQRHWLGSFTLEEDAAEACRAFRAEHMPFSAEALS